LEATSSADTENKTRPIEGVISAVRATSWFLEGSANSIETDFLCDTGATFTCIDKDLFDEIPSHQRPEINNVDVILKSANNEVLNLYGEAQFKITFGTQSFDFPVKIVDFGDKSAILGADFMEHYDCEISMKRGILKILSRKYHVNMHKKKASKCARIQVSHPTCIPPNQEVMIQGKIGKGHKSVLGCYGTIEQANTLIHCTG
jgi:predicted aspartyl protease